MLATLVFDDCDC